jgi:hypothetical protein
MKLLIYAAWQEMLNGAGSVLLTTLLSTSAITLAGVYVDSVDVPNKV